MGEVKFINEKNYEREVKIQNLLWGRSKKKCELDPKIHKNVLEPFFFCIVGNEEKLFKTPLQIKLEMLLVEVVFFITSFSFQLFSSCVYDL